MDQELHLPFGYGFDEIIKEKNELISSKKFHNNKVMDDIVEKLGYIDYRDALAANKFILEAKKHGSVHQQARAKTLSLAMSRLNAIKQSEIERAAADKIKSDPKLDRDQVKLDMIMNEDS